MNQFNRHLAVFGFARDLPISLGLDGAAQGAPDNRVIVYEEDFDSHRPSAGFRFSAYGIMRIAQYRQPCTFTRECNQDVHDFRHLAGFIDDRGLEVRSR